VEPARRQGTRAGLDLTGMLWQSPAAAALGDAVMKWEMSSFLRFFTVGVFSAFCASLALSFCSRAALQIEILALRHQLDVLQRWVKRPKTDRIGSALLGMALSHLSDWRSALVVVQPDTVITWHRKGFRLFWS
jgi:hypothetical protein